ncbi:hypothetical protein CN171_14870 [Sinorhizobium meliloti]|nr:hypothetical protein CN171_14870 [Sinorhizobium meliloti]RVJ84785.1 hypothetical protein CN169_32065 [Sinorhizobium meliloti]
MMRIRGRTRPRNSSFQSTSFDRRRSKLRHHGRSGGPHINRPGHCCQSPRPSAPLRPKSARITVTSSRSTHTASSIKDLQT